MFRNTGRMIRRAVAMDCANAMEDARWYERFALGVICTGLLAGCAVS